MRRRHVGYLPLRPAQLIRRGCVGCLTVLVLVLLLLAALIGLGLVLGTQIASAAEPAPSALLLSAAIAEAPAAPAARGVFAQRSLTISVPAGRVMLASTPDGSGALCSDDQVEISFHAGSTLHYRWSHTFTDRQGAGIVCLPPQDLTGALPAGNYQVEVRLIDRYPPTYSARAFYLVVMPVAVAGNAASPAPLPPTSSAPTARPAVAMPAPTRPLHPSSLQDAQLVPTRSAATRQAGDALPTSTAVAAPVFLPTRSAAAQQDREVLPVPTLVATLAPLPATRSGPMAPGAGAARELRGNLGGWRGLLCGAVLLSSLALLLGTALLRRSIRLCADPRLPGGILDLYDRASGEAQTVLLTAYPAGALVLRRPLRVVAASENAQTVSSEATALIQPGAPTPILCEPAAAAAQAVDLEPDRSYALAGGELTLRYRR